ncbi:MAG: binary toxin-like calcium binding domain-containing protein, partial [Promethearchaeota archaeon]
KTFDYIQANIADLIVRSLFPIDPMSATAITLPESSGYAGPVGLIIDMILHTFEGQSLTVGGEYESSVEDSGYGTAEGGISAAFGLEWSFSLSVLSEDTVSGIAFSTQQAGLTGTLLEALAGVEIAVEGEGDFTLKIITDPVVRVEVIDWHLRIRITLSRTIGLYDLIEKIWPSAKKTVDKLPKKIRGKVKRALNRVKITPYLGGEFEIFSNVDGNDEYVIAVFFGVSMNVDVPVVDIGGGVEVELAFHFTSQGNFFVLTLEYGFSIDVPWPFKDKRNKWTQSWQVGPDSSDGKQMNTDSDGDGLTDSFEIEIGTNPNKLDSDNDTLPDGVELSEYGTFPTNPDSDNDGLSDGEEVSYFEGKFVDPLGDYDLDNLPHVLDPDSDNDGLLDGEEVKGLNPYGFPSNPLKVDTDGDGLIDKEEVDDSLEINVDGSIRSVYCDPMNYDSDGDFLHDLEEVMMNSDPFTPDTDGDGISDFEEARVFSVQWNQTDTDNDGLSDGQEILGMPVRLYDPATKSYQNVTLTSNPNLVDSDGDGLTDFEEMSSGTEITWQGGPLIAFSNPRSMDTDFDGLSDYEEVFLGADLYQTKPDVNDTDNDGLKDSEYLIYGTDPTNDDTDNDNVLDGLEVNFWKSQPLKNDSDSDRLLDGYEIANFTSFDTNFGPSSNYDADPYTGIMDFDSDDGGVSDGAEVEANNGTYTFNLTDPSDDKYADSDHDGMPNQWEDKYGFNPFDPSDNTTDNDTDSLSNVEEYQYGTSPLDSDTDSDGLTDGEEVLFWSSDPLKKDSDGDGLIDGPETLYLQSILPSSFTPSSDFDGDGLAGIMDNDSDNDALLDGTEERLSITEYGGRLVNATDPDTDEDGLDDGSEVLLYRTDPTLMHSDSDILTDFEEVSGQIILWHGNPIIVYSDPNDPDTDHDGLPDHEEILIWHSFPTDPDSDDDQIFDGDEVFYFSLYGGGTPADDFDIDLITGIQDNDSDNDRLLDGEELSLGTNPTVSDTDNDLISDYEEVRGYGFTYLDPFTGLPEQILYFTNPLNNDSDSDGLIDGIEVNGIPYHSGVVYTDPTNIDTDGDGLIDGFEVTDFNITVMSKNLTIITNPMDPDTDQDGISDFEEIYSWNWYSKRTYDARERTGFIPIGNIPEGPPLQIQVTRATQYTSIAALRGGYITDPTDNDTDDDGLIEGTEKYGVTNYTYIKFPTHNFEANFTSVITNPVKNDTDGDGLSDGFEVNTTNPHVSDTDQDGISDYEEINIYHTNPNSYDTDNDQINDKYELFISYYNSTLPVDKTDPRDSDTDDDGLPDGFEKSILHTHPLNNDSDFDLLLDGDEVNLYETNPFLNDTDNDGLTDSQELFTYLTEPTDPDSDGDGIYDGVEVNYYITDPLIPDENDDELLDGWDYDFDEDGLSDYEETIVYETLYYENDTDEDGLTDGDEHDYFVFWDEDPGGDPDKDGLSSLHDFDSDNDGINDSVEFEFGINPANEDTDKRRHR